MMSLLANQNAVCPRRVYIKSAKNGSKIGDSKLMIIFLGWYKSIHCPPTMDMHVQNQKYRNLVFISWLTSKCATQKLKNYAVLVYGHVYIILSY